MTRRHDALLPLTHDHHHALVQARALVQAGSGSDEERAQTTTAFLDFYEEHTLLHFHEEEEVLFPLLLEVVGEAPAELIQVLVEHVRIHGMVHGLRAAASAATPEGAHMAELGETLRRHVRLEENRLFPMIEETVPDEDLRALRFAPRDRG